MTKPTIYIDGQQGTTGLRIRDLLAPREDLEVLLIPPTERKNTHTRAAYLNKADISILCLPDDAAAEAVELVTNPAARIIDTSTPRRIQDDWVYGLPELSPAQRQTIITARRVANCGCYPVGFLLAVRPLVVAGLLDPMAALTINAVSGYSGGGRQMIESYEAAPQPKRATDAARPLCLYGLDATHKHLAEIHKFSLLERPPIFVPSVDHSYCGMLVSTPIPASCFVQHGITPQQVWEVWQDYYHDSPFINPINPNATKAILRDEKFLDLAGAAFTNRVDLSVFGQPEQGLVLIGRLDNLGKGASGNAVQCLNLMLGYDECTGLE